MSTIDRAGLEAHLCSLGLKTPIPHFADLDVLTDPLDLAKTYLADQVQEIVQGGADHALSAVQLPATVDPLGGDLTIILPKLAREVGLGVDELRDSIISKFPKHPLFQQPAPDGKQLKIFFHSKALASIILPFIHDRSGVYGVPHSESTLPKPKLLVESSSPNIVTEMNGKHFRSALLGAQLAAMHHTHNWEVVKINYLGDTGKPIGLLGAGYEKFGSEELLETKPVEHLRDVYKQISDLFAPEQAASKKARDDAKGKEENGESAEIESRGVYAERNTYAIKLEQGDEKMVRLWQTLRDASIAEYEQTYARLDVQFDEYTGESQVKAETMADIVEKLKDKGICEESEGSLVIHLHNHGSKHGTAIIKDRTGGSTYLLRELAAVLERHDKYNFDKMLYIVANDQHTMHFHRLSKILELLGMEDLAKKLHHVSFNENSQLPEPSSPGDSLDAILDRFEDTIGKSVNMDVQRLGSLCSGSANSKAVVKATCFAQASSIKRTGELKFDMTKLTAADATSPLYPLAWFARLSTVNSAVAPVEAENDASGEQDYLDDYENAVLLRWLAHYPGVVQNALRNLEPSMLMHYLGNLTGQLSDAFEDDEEVIASNTEHSKFLQAVGIVIANSLKLLNITQTRARDSGIFV